MLEGSRSRWGGELRVERDGYCRAIQNGDYDAAVPLTVVGAEALHKAEQGPAFERDARVAEVRRTQRVDIERYYRQIFPPSARWKILEVGESRVWGVKLVYVEISYPVKDEADFTSELDHNLNQVRHHVKKGIYSAPVDEKNKRLVDLPNFRPISQYKVLEYWD